MCMELLVARPNPSCLGNAMRYPGTEMERKRIEKSPGTIRTVAHINPSRSVVRTSEIYGFPNI